jgi:hypothetical protein
MTNYDGGGWDVDPHGGGVRRCGYCGTVGARLLCAAEVEQVLAVAADRIAAMGQTPPGYNLSTLLADALRGCERDAERRNPVPEGDGTGKAAAEALRAAADEVDKWWAPSMHRSPQLFADWLRYRADRVEHAS